MKKLIRVFENMPIARKINFAILFTCCMALAVAALAIFLAQLITFRHRFNRDLETIGQMLGQNATAFVTFKDPKGAAEILAAVKARPQILRAAIVLPGGAEFAAWPSQVPSWPPAAPQADGFHVLGPNVLLNQPVVLKEERIGTLRLFCDYRTEYYRSLRVYATILGSVLGASILLALFLSNLLQRLISGPILSLTGAARTIAEEQDYSVRAPLHFEDEVGQLTAAFNQMLTRIQSQDKALTASKRKLAALVNSIDGIVWERSLDSMTFTFVSQQSNQMLGYSPNLWVDSPGFWKDRLHVEDAAKAVRICREAVERRQPYHQEYRMLAADNRPVWMRESGVVLIEGDKPVAVRGILTDITAQREANEKLEKLNRKLQDASRLAGMSEVATGVLHNVGNILNSVNVSVNVINEQLARSQTGHLIKLSSLMDAHRENLGEFLSTDPKGRRVPEFLRLLAAALEEERGQIVHETKSLLNNVEHIKEIVAMQQSYAKLYGLTEDLPPAALVEDAIRMNEGAFARHGVRIQRDFHPVPLVRVDKHKVLQILVNLLRNAKYAMDANGKADKLLTIAVRRDGDARVKVTVRDNGVGIARENLTRIFAHGFTTKRDGHGFGLHSGANAAKEMGGLLYADSEGLGKGASFILEMPAAAEKPNDMENQYDSAI